MGMPVRAAYPLRPVCFALAIMAHQHTPTFTAGDADALRALANATCLPYCSGSARHAALSAAASGALSLLTLLLVPVFVNKHGSAAQDPAFAHTHTHTHNSLAIRGAQPQKKKAASGAAAPC